MVWHDMVWHDGMSWYGMVWHDMIWYGTSHPVVNIGYNTAGLVASPYRRAHTALKFFNRVFTKLIVSNVMSSAGTNHCFFAALGFDSGHTSFLPRIAGHSRASDLLVPSKADKRLFLTKSKSTMP